MKTQINKSEVMKAAWTIFRSGKVTFSIALKAAWAKAKYNVENVMNWYGQMMPLRTNGKKIFLSIAIKTGRTYRDTLINLLLNDDNNPDSLIQSYDLITDTVMS